MMENIGLTNSTVKTEFIQAGGIQFAYRSFGNDIDTPLVCMQHITGTMDNWDPIVTNGLAQGRRVILFDNTGVGDSNGETPNNIQKMAMDAVTFIAALKLAKVDLLAYSLGGFIGQIIVDQHPELVRKLVLVGTGPQGGEGIDQFRAYFMNAVQATGYEVFLRLFFTKSDRSRSLGMQALQRLGERTENRDTQFSERTFLNQTKAIEDWGLAKDEDFSLLKRIQQHVLVINGHNDEMFPTINSYNMFHYIPNAQLSLYPDSAHGSIYQYPELFVEQVSYFLDH